MPTNPSKAAEFIVPLNINGLQGRMLRMGATKRKSKEILLIYGHHAMLERWFGLAENLAEFGNVTMPDLPGFGGMDSFYKVGKRPEIDAFADYLVSFIKLRYKNKKITIYAISYGFVVVTRMLQRYPEIAKKVELLVSFAGFMHEDDILYGRTKRRVYRKISRLLATRPAAAMIHSVGYSRPILNRLYRIFPNSKRRMIDLTPEEFDLSIDFELVLWRSNDVRTHWLTTSEFLKLDNLGSHVSIPVVHVLSKKDHYLNNIVVEQHMRQVFAGYSQYTSQTKAHVPSVLADKKAMSVMIPPGLKKELNGRAKYNKS
jgi:pimeloyl-ACP methyl ester carboxylesterase